MEKDSKILVTGATGMVGSALLRALRARNYRNVLSPSRRELDLTDGNAVDDYFEKHRPRYVFMVAAKVGGIAANIADPVGFLVDNLQIQINLFKACWKHRTVKNLFLGSSCIYPRECPQPMREDFLLTGPLEPTNEGYALAKIAGLKMASYYRRQHGMATICAVPCNIYGTNDHFDLQRAHVLTALVKRFVDAADEGRRFVTLWGTGQPRREFIHVDDVADALLHLMERYDEPDIINVGTGEDLSIGELADMVSTMAGFRGEIRWDASRPDGMPRKCLDVSKLYRLGFRPKICLRDGIRRTIEEYRAIRRVKEQG